MIGKFGIGHGLIVFLFIASFLRPDTLQAQYLPDEKEVTVTFVEIPIDSALILLSSQSGVNIAFDPNIIPEENRVTLSANKLLLGLALDDVFVNTDLYYKLTGNQIVIKEREAFALISNATLSGYIVDSRSGEKLVYGTLLSSDGMYGCTANDFGYFSLTLPLGYHKITFSYVGYEQHEIDIDLHQDTFVNISLDAQVFLNEVVILGEVPKESRHTEEYDQLPIELLGGLPSLAGEPDIIRMAQTRAGVFSQVDGFGGLQVRGGATDQNLILLDGVPVYNTGHALGLFSIFNSSAIKSANLIKGGFPARYGGRLSSVLDVRIKEGNNQEISGDVAISPLLVKASLEGPIQRGKSSFLLSARRTIVDPWLRPLSRYQFERSDEEGQINFFFYDINAKVNFDLGSKNELYLSAYVGKDRYANEVLGNLNDQSGNVIEELDVNDVSWGNKIITLRWTSNFNKKMFGHASVSYTEFQFDNFDFDRTILNPGANTGRHTFTSRLFSSIIEDYIGSYDVDWYISPHYYLKFGANYTRHTMRPGSDFTANEDELLDDQDLVNAEIIKSVRSFEEFKGEELRGFIENEIRVGTQFSANLGLHYSSINVNSGSRYANLQPRIAAKLKLNDKITLKGGYSHMNQYFHLLSSAGLGLPSDVWLPSTDLIPPEISKQISASLELALPANTNVTISGYDKNMENITGFAQGSVFDISGNINWQDNVPIGTGTARGIEVEVEKRAGRFMGWLSYTLSESMRTFESVNEGLPFRANNDRRHLVNLNVLSQLNDNMELSLGWTYGSSLPTTIPASPDPVIVDGRLFYVLTYRDINNALLPTYHKLDVGFNLYNKYNWGSQKFSIGAYNVYARRNPFYIEAVFDNSGEFFRFEQVSILPFVPYISLGLTF